MALEPFISPRQAARVVGKYPDRDYSPQGIANRVDAAEDALIALGDIADVVQSVKRAVKFWGPTILAGVVSSGIVGGKWGDFFAIIGKAIGQ